MERSKLVLDEVNDLYEVATTSMGKWMWRNHTQWVADKAKSLAEKYGADVEKVYCAALLHDLGDSKYERGDENFDTWSKEKGEEILLEAGFTQGEVEEVWKLFALMAHAQAILQLPKKVEY